MLKIYYDLNRLRVGSLLKRGNAYYFVLGYESMYLNYLSTLTVVGLGRKKPKDLLEVHTFLMKKENLDFTYLLGDKDAKLCSVVKYDYFDFEQSKALLVKYNLLNSTRLYPDIHVKFVKRSKVEKGKYYQDVLKMTRKQVYQCTNERGQLTFISSERDIASRIIKNIIDKNGLKEHHVSDILMEIDEKQLHYILQS